MHVENTKAQHNAPPDAQKPRAGELSVTGSMRNLVFFVFLSLFALFAHAETTKRGMTAQEIEEMKLEVQRTPINTFRFLGNSLVCKSDSANDEFACFRIGGLRVGDDYKPKQKPWKELPQEGGITASVHPIVANDEFNAYWVIGHKDRKITSIQLTGNYPNDELAFSTIKLTDPKEKVRKILGPRFHEREVKSINGVMWDYFPFPITIEIVKDKVYSIRIAERTSNKPLEPTR